MKKTYAKIVLLGIGCLILLAILLNFNYFWQQYKFRTGQIQVTEQPVEQGSEAPAVVLEPNQIFIPSLGIKAPVQNVVEADENIFQTALQSGVVQYPGTAAVGELGNVYIFGHSSDLVYAKGDYKTVFALLPQIENGADIYISNQAGTTFQYQVFEQFVVESDDLSVLDQKEYKEKLLTLQTSYPLGTALRRYIVQAKLVE